MAGNWPLVRLSELVTKIGSGATPRGGAEAYLENGPFALIRSQNVLDFEFKYDGLAYIDDLQAKQLEGVSVESGDILINITGDSVARVCIVDPEVLPARVNQHVSIIRADPAELNQRYLFYVLASPVFKQHLLSIAGSGATRNALTKGDLEKVMVPRPSLSEQASISSLLGSIDDRIDLNRRMIASLEEVARTLFKDWFVDFNPVRAKIAGVGKNNAADFSAIFPSNFGEDRFPEGWGATADDIGLNIRETVLPGELPPETPYVGLEHIGKRRLVLTEIGTAKEVDSQKAVFKVGDLLFGKLRPYFHKVAIASSDGICSTDIFVFRPKPGISRMFLYLAFSSDAFVAHASRPQEGTRMPRADWGFMRSQIMAKPDLRVMTAFDDAVEPLITEAQKAARQNQTLAEVRDVLLPQLISGEIRVKDAESVVEAA